MPDNFNLEIIVFLNNRIGTFQQYSDAVLNSFLKDLVKSRECMEIKTLANKIKIKSQPRNQILASNISLFGSEIDFLTIDAEGLDYEVISNDWNKYRQKLFLLKF